MAARYKAKDAQPSADVGLWPADSSFPVGAWGRGKRNICSWGGWASEYLIEVIRIFFLVYGFYTCLFNNETARELPSSVTVDHRTPRGSSGPPPPTVEGTCPCPHSDPFPCLKMHSCVIRAARMAQSGAPAASLSTHFCVRNQDLWSHGAKTQPEPSCGSLAVTVRGDHSPWLPLHLVDLWVTITDNNRWSKVCVLWWRVTLLLTENLLQIEAFAHDQKDMVPLAAKLWDYAVCVPTRGAHVLTTLSSVLGLICCYSGILCQ